MNLCNNEENGLVRIGNGAEFLLYFEVSYLLGGKYFEFCTKIIDRGSVAQVSFPKEAYNIKIRIFISIDGLVWSNTYSLLYKESGQYCFVVLGVYDNPRIERILCKISTTILGDICKCLC